MKHEFENDDDTQTREKKEYLTTMIAEGIIIPLAFGNSLFCFD